MSPITASPHRNHPQKSLKNPLWKFLIGIAAAIGLFVAVWPQDMVFAIVTLVTAAALAGLILIAKQDNMGTIWHSIAWSLGGAVVATTLSPNPPLHPPLRFLFLGIICGWALGSVLAHTQAPCSSRPLRPEWRALLWLTLGLTGVIHVFGGGLLLSAHQAGIPAIVIVTFAVVARVLSILPLGVYLHVNKCAGRQTLRSGLLLVAILAILLSIFSTEVPFVSALLRIRPLHGL